MARRVVVLGAGYAGLVTAKRLARAARGGAAVTLVNSEAGFVERIRLHQVAAGQRIAELPLTELVAGSGVRLVVGVVTALELASREVRVETEGGATTLAYDTLVYGLGSRIRRDGVPGVAEHAFILADPGSAAALCDRMREVAARRGTVVVCGAGLTGIEVAAELAEAHPPATVRLVARGEPGDWLSPSARVELRRQLDRSGIEVVAGAEVVGIEPTGVRLGDGRSLAAEATVWCGGFDVPELARSAGLAVNARGRVLVDPTLRSVSHPEVYAVGDAAAVPGPWGEEIAFGCRSGGFTGPYVADAIAARLAGRTPRPFRFRYLHQCVSLGRRRGLIQFVRGRDERPRRLFLRGRLAAWYKEIVSASAIWLFRHPGPHLPHLPHLPRLPGRRP